MAITYTKNISSVPDALVCVLLSADFLIQEQLYPCNHGNRSWQIPSKHKSRRMERNKHFKKAAHKEQDSTLSSQKRSQWLGEYPGQEKISFLMLEGQLLGCLPSSLNNKRGLHLMLFFRITAVLCEDLHTCSVKAFLNIWQIKGLNTELP